MKLALLVCIVLAVVAKQAYSQACHLREVDLCMAIGMFHFQSNGIPPNEEQVDDWCETITEVQDCMGNFTSKCMSPVQRELTTLMGGSMDAATEMCTAGSDVRARYLEHGECLAGAADSDEFRTQVKDVQVVVETLFETPYRKRFPLICCSFNRFNKGLETLTNKRCGEASVKMVRDLIAMVTTDLPEVICEQFNLEGEECKTLLPPSGTPSKGADNKSQIGRLLDTVLGNL